MFKLLLLLSCLVALGSARLTTSGTNLLYNGKKVFLSGVNIAWNSYGYDFGNGQYAANSKSTLEGWMNSISGSGGNSLRKFLFFYLVERSTDPMIRLLFFNNPKVFGFMWRVTTHRRTTVTDSSLVPTGQAQ